MLIAGLIATAAGCQIGGQPAPSGYSCGNVTVGHCYSEALLGDHVTGFRSTFTVVGQLSSGNGFVTNEFWLRNYRGTDGWIELGYIQNGVEPLHYFVGVLDPMTSVFRSTEIAPVPDTEIGERVTFDVHQTAEDTFSVEVNGPTTKQTRQVHVDLWDGTYGGSVALGMELAGTSGATAGFAMFVNNQVYDTNFQRTFALGPTSASSSAPPYGGWLQEPAEGTNGGTFNTYCCAK